jgi:hypothetical protein
MEVHEPVQPAHPMKWHKFLIYFHQSAIYIFRGVLCVVMAVLAIYVRFCLAGFRKNAPRVYSIFLGITCALQILSLIDAFGTGIYALRCIVRWCADASPELLVLQQARRSVRQLNLRKSQVNLACDFCCPLS